MDLNGDLITGENAFLGNSTEYIDMMVEPLIRRGIPSASAYGNHDSNFNLSREGIPELERRHSLAKAAQMGATTTCRCMRIVIQGSRHHFSGSSTLEAAPISRRRTSPVTESGSPTG